MGKGIINWVDGLKTIFFGLCVIFTLFAFVFMFTPLASVLARPLIMEPDVKKSDLIIVMGGGAYPNGVLGEASGERFLAGILLYKEGFGKKVFFAGGSITGASKKIIHAIFKSGGNGAIDVVESTLMLDIAKKLGIPETALHADVSSTNTYANLLAAKEHMEKNNLKTCLIVTSPTHMYRSRKVSEKLGLDCGPAPVKDYTRYANSAMDRLELSWKVFWEYAALALYKAYGYI